MFRHRFAALLLACLAPFLAVHAQDVARGQQLYRQWCTACHAADPSQDRPAAIANNPEALELAIFAQPAMRFLGAVLSDADVRDLAAYVGSVVNPGGSVQPQLGWYGNPAESGRGFFYERRGDAIYMAGFHYEADGRADWFVVPGFVSANRFAAAMVELAGGQTLTGPYRAPAATPSPGFVQLGFGADASAMTMTWPGGVTPLQRFPFGSDGSVQAPQAGAPESGWWWNPAESGRGFAIEFQGGNVFVCGFMYDDAGLPIWYLTAGAMQTPTRYAGNWQRFANGQAMGAPHRAPVVSVPDAGSVVLEFSDARNGTLTLPDGRRVAITRFLF